jgi:DNA-binding MarR family transcriptional regulator
VSRRKTQAAIEFMARKCVGNQLRLLDRVVTSGKDSRSRPLHLTATGERVLEDAIVAWKGAQAKAVGFLGEEGVALLRRTTKKVRARTSAD